MLQPQKRIPTITIFLLGLALFFLCSWTLAASIIETPANPVSVTDNFKPEEIPAKETKPLGHETQPPPSIPPTIPAEVVKPPLFPAEPYSQEVLRGKREEADKQIALTFDDGPDPDWTAKYLDVLDQEHVPATFFFIGSQVKKYPLAAEAVVAAGHEIGIHSHTHRELTRLNEAQIKQDLVDSAQAIYSVNGQTLAYFRPPYGATDGRVKNVAHELGQTIVTWNVDPRDWETNDPDQIINEVLRQVEAGSIILLHEGKAQTLRALPAIIQHLRQKGYSFVTVSDLFGFAPGKSVPVSTKANASPASDPVARP